jgi:hypothetical protein
MKKTAEQIAYEVLAKLAEDGNLHPQVQDLLRGAGMLGGGAIGTTLGGLAGAGIGSSIRSFPGYETTHQVPRALGKVINNPATRGFSKVLPFLGMGTGLLAGARKGHDLFEDKPEITTQDLQFILDNYLNGAV